VSEGLDSLCPTASTRETELNKGELISLPVGNFGARKSRPTIAKIFRDQWGCLRLPALRDRKEDIPRSWNIFWQARGNRDAGFRSCVRPNGHSDENTMPGNIRELQNLAKRMIAWVARVSPGWVQPIAKADENPPKSRKSFL